MSAAYQIDRISAGYGSRNVLQDVSLDLRRGELVGVIGPNGCGKSTLLRVMTGLLAPSGGEVLLEGNPLASYTRRLVARQVAVVPQSQSPIFAFTVREVVEMGRAPWQRGWNTPSSEDKRLVAGALEQCDLLGLEDRPVNELSGGELQRVAVARAIAQGTSILLLDEPTSHLDLGHQLAIFNLLHKLAADCNVAVLCVSHDLHLAPEYCDRLILMGRGKVVAVGTPKEILTQKNLRAIYGVDVEIHLNPHTGHPYVLLTRPEEKEKA
jgi:iron complex transport system ATP-binding protein